MTVVTCPHCGDRTEQQVGLAEFTCGRCDKTFAPAPEPRQDSAWVTEQLDRHFNWQDSRFRGWDAGS